MHIGNGPPATRIRNARRALIIRRHRAMLEAEIRRLKILPEDDSSEDEVVEP